MQKILIHGAGRVGLPLAHWLSLSIDNEVIIVDSSYDTTRSLVNGKVALYEPNLDISRVKVYDPACELDTYDWIFICYEPENELATDTFIKTLEPLIGKGKLVLRGATPPGTAKRISLKYGIDVASCPAQLSKGNSVADELNVLKSVGDVQGTLADDLVAFFVRHDMLAEKVADATTAEIIKLTVSTFKYILINYTLEAQKICWRFGVDIFEVIDQCNKNASIANNQLKMPGLGAYGDCLTRDSAYFAKYAYRGGMIRGATKINNWPLKRIAKHINENYKTVAALGLSIKSTPLTDDIVLSPFTQLQFLCPDIAFQTWDPVISGNCNSIDDALQGAEAVIVLSSAINISNFKLDSNVEVIDPWHSMTP